MERKRTTMGEAAQIRYKSALPPMVYYPPMASQFLRLISHDATKWIRSLDGNDDD